MVLFILEFKIHSIYSSFLVKNRVAFHFIFNFIRVQKLTRYAREMLVQCSWFANRVYKAAQRNITPSIRFVARELYKSV